MDESRRIKKALRSTLDREWKDDPEGVQVLAKQVRDLMAQPGWLALQELIGKTRQSHERLVFEGPTLSQADYARSAGVISGLSGIENAGQVILEKAGELDQKDRQIAEVAEKRERQTAAGGS